MYPDEVEALEKPWAGEFDERLDRCACCRKRKPDVGNVTDEQGRMFCDDCAECEAA